MAGLRALGKPGPATRRVITAGALKRKANHACKPAIGPDGEPVYLKVGDLVSIYGEVTKVGRTSITIALETVVRRRTEDIDRRVTHGTYVFVAIDEQGKPRPVPQPEWG